VVCLSVIVRPGKKNNLIIDCSGCYSPAGIEGSNPAGRPNVCILGLLCVVR
jgi:hypothetical protein